MSTAVIETEEVDPYLADAPEESADEIALAGRVSDLERGLAKLGWLRVENGVYLHNDGSEIHCQIGTKRGTNVQVRVFTLTYGSGRNGGVALNLAALVNAHREGKGGTRRP